MKITRKSIVSGKVRTLDIPATPQQMAAYESGVLVQDAFPTLSPVEREFILSGITAEEWEEMFCLGKFQRNTDGSYVGWLDLAALESFPEKEGRIYCRLIPDDEKYPLVFMKLVGEQPSD